MTAVYVTPVSTEYLVVLVGNGATPTEVFTATCLINAGRSLKVSATESVQLVPRCDDPTQPMKTQRVITGTDVEISGDGVLNSTDALTYTQQLLTGQPKNLKFVAPGTGNLVLSGPFVLTDFTVTGSKQGDLVTASLTWKQANQVTAAAGT